MKVATVPDLVFESIAQFDKPDCIKFKKDGAWQNISGKQIIATVEALAAELIHLGVRKGDRIGLLSENRPEWAYMDLAIQCAGAITVPIYGTLPAKQVEYILNNSELAILFVSSAPQLEKVREIAKDVPALKQMIVCDHCGPAPDVSQLAEKIAHGKEVLAVDPQMVRKRAAESKPDDVFSIIYTSGTTGEPKGVMLTHDNVLSNVRAVRDFFRITTQDVALSFLPLSHIFERMAGYYLMLHEGCTIVYAESVEALPKNLAEVRPTVLFSVPRVYEKFYGRVMDNVASEHGAKKKIATWSLKVASEYAERMLNNKSVSPLLRLRYAMADALVLKKIRNRMGGRLRLLVSGGAALPKQLGVFFYGLGLRVLEGYGLTETSPVIAVNRPEKLKFGTVGPPIPGVEIKIAEDGEILTRGPHIMKGYYKKPKETSDAITEGGWFHTGDIGEIDPDGYLRITDRKKDLIVTSGGKNIAPQFVENALKTCKYIAQIVVVGDKRKYASALIVPNVDNLRKFAASRGIPENQMLSSREILNEIHDEIEKLSSDLAPFERVKKIALLEHEFTIESGELTPSLKIKRNVVEKRYKDVIDSLYSEPLAET